MRQILIGIAALSASLVMLATGTASAASTYSLFGDATAVSFGGNPGAFVQVTSNATAPGYGGIDFSLPTGTTVSALNTLSTDYEVLSGDCGGGAPRFSISISNTESIFVYLGPTPNFTGCSTGWQSS